jgi:hypothetical protein
MPTRVCTVRGFDYRGDPLTFHVEAEAFLKPQRGAWRRSGR